MINLTVTEVSAEEFDEFKQTYGISGLDDLTDLFTNKVNRNVDSGGVSAGFTSTGGGWEFFWDNPTEIYKLLLGEDIMLVKYHMPELDFNFNWDQFFPVVGPLGVRASVTFGAKIDFTFGYDTLGIRQWVKSDFRDVEKLFISLLMNSIISSLRSIPLVVMVNLNSRSMEVWGHPLNLMWG